MKGTDLLEIIVQNVWVHNTNITIFCIYSSVCNKNLEINLLEELKTMVIMGILTQLHQCGVTILTTKPDKL